MPGCDSQLQDLVLAELDDFHPTAIQEQEDSARLRAFFPDRRTRDAATGALAAAFGKHLFTAPVDVEDEDWAARSQAALGPVTVGRITIVPPWETSRTDRVSGIENSSGRLLSIVIRPSMGFGTGHHATTRLMLAALQTIEVRDCGVLDVGCGSGVLAIAAIGLGARSAIAIDIDPDALESAAENVSLNRVSDRVRLELRDFREFQSSSAVVLANLNAALLERYASALAALVEPGGRLIVSGFTESQTVMVIPALEKFLTRQRTDAEEEWQCGIFTAND